MLSRRLRTSNFLFTVDVFTCLKIQTFFIIYTNLLENQVNCLMVNFEPKMSGRVTLMTKDLFGVEELSSNLDKL